MALAVAAALEDLGVSGEVWPHVDGDPPPAAYAIELASARRRAPRRGRARPARARAARAAAAGAAGLGGDRVARPPRRRRALRAAGGRARRARPARRRELERPVAAEGAGAGGAGATRRGPGHGARFAEPGAAVAAELEIFGGAVGLVGLPGALVAKVTTGYVPRDMSLPDDAHVELTVALGTTRLPLRQVLELAIGHSSRSGARWPGRSSCAPPAGWWGRASWSMLTASWACAS